MELSVDRKEALRIARNYLATHEKIDPEKYMSAVVLNVDRLADNYLQITSGFKGAEKFIDDYQYDLFVWAVRFVREKEKEEFRVIISSKTGEIVSFTHFLDDSTVREVITEENAQKIAEKFIQQRYRIDLENYVVHDKTTFKKDKRTDYRFAWEHKNVYIRWNLSDPNSGGAKLVTNVTVSGHDILGFNKQFLVPPDQYYRQGDTKGEFTRNLGLIVNVLRLILLVGSIWFVIVRRNHLAMNITKPFYIRVAIFLFLVSVLSQINGIQALIYSYPTTQPLVPYFLRYFWSALFSTFWFVIGFIIPCLAGELLYFELFPKKPKGGFFHYVTTTFWSRQAAAAVVWGYIFAILMIGLQTGIFEFGYRYLGVWAEYSRITGLSSGYLPFLSIFVLAANASFTEETFYRIFGISFLKKNLRNLSVAVFCSSVLWGFAHTGYLVFPSWFRGLEVTIIGIFTAVVYLRFGILCVIVQHFIFDAFWASSPYIFGHSSRFDLCMAILVLSLPLIFAFCAYVKNQPVVQTGTEWRLSPQQQFNLEILKGFIERQSQNANFIPDQLRNQLIKNGWDVAVVDVAFQRLNIHLSSENTTFQA